MTRGAQDVFFLASMSSSTTVSVDRRTPADVPTVYRSSSLLQMLVFLLIALAFGVDQHRARSQQAVTEEVIGADWAIHMRDVNVGNGLRRLRAWMSRELHGMSHLHARLHRRGWDIRVHGSNWAFHIQQHL